MSRVKTSGSDIRKKRQDIMNFAEFNKKVEDMKLDLEQQGVTPEDVKISYYTKSTGEHIIVAMKGNMVVSYFKW